MNILYLLSGILVLIAIGVDFFYTTLSFNGAGHLTRITNRALSGLFLFLNRHIPNRRALKFSGVTHILCLIVLWIGSLWFGFFLLLMSTPASVVEAGTGTAAGAFTKLYFSGYTLSTLGMGDYIPGTKAWQVVTSVFSFAGFIFITTAMTYLMSLTNAVTHKKKLALFISNLGDSPEEIVLNSYLGRKPALLMDRIPVLQDMINSHNQNHFAHPAVHYFHSSAKKESFSINLANLNEAIIIITYFIKYDSAVEKELRLLQDAIAKFLVTASHHYKPITKTALRDTPALESLGRQGIPTIDEPILSSADWQNIERRRAQLTGLLQSNGWNWQHIFAKPQS